MVFRRRDRRPLWRVALEFLWPRGGWGRAAQYVRHRVRRLPDTPEKISRGIWAGVFTAFTPFYGLHFLVAALIAKVMRGNILASLMATFFGNPLTYVPIGVVSLQTGYWLLGMRPALDPDISLARKFARAFWDLYHNATTVFTGEPAHWSYLTDFYTTVFVPYLVGGLAPGMLTAVVSYVIAVPVLRAYQHRRPKIRRAANPKPVAKLKSVADSPPKAK